MHIIKNSIKKRRIDACPYYYQQNPRNKKLAISKLKLGKW